MIEGVIFDFNGTLFWDTPLHNQAWDQFLDRHNIYLTDDEKADRIHGKHNPAILKGLFGEQISGPDIRKYSIEKELIYQQLCISSGLNLAAGATDLILFLRSRNIPYTIATASDKINVDFFFEFLNLDQFFHKNMVVYNDGTLKSKPHPDFFSKAMQILNIQPSNTLIFEDSKSGIQAAENANAGKIVIVNSNMLDHSGSGHEQIMHFDEFDKSVFFESKTNL